MLSKTPQWWQANTHHSAPKYLSPFGQLYGQMVKARFALTRPYQSKIPVVCIGNFTVGGTGKTPIALKIGAMLQNLGYSPTFLSRGYKGSYPGPVLVNEDEHAADQVGDEALLLSRKAPTVIAKNKVEGAWLIEQRHSDVIVMDDGFQNPSIAKDLNIIVVDGENGIGNGETFPAGPLRAPLTFQLPKSDVIIINGGSKTRITTLLGEHAPLNQRILHGTLITDNSQDLDWLEDKPILGFAGIGQPEKFFKSLEAAGGQVIRRQPFPDHYNYKSSDAAQLIARAKTDDLQLVTTEKDLARLVGAADHMLNALARLSKSLPVHFSFSGTDENKLTEILSARLVKKNGTVRD